MPDQTAACDHEWVTVFDKIRLIDVDPIFGFRGEVEAKHRECRKCAATDE